MPPAASAESLPAPSAFRLHASNGYTLTVVGSRNPHTGQGSVLVFAQAHASAVLYATPATVTETSIEANLGPVGTIGVDFVPSGEGKSERSSCGGKAVTFDSGNYVGTIDFEGEEGYSEVQATSAHGEEKFLLDLLCGGIRSEGAGGHSPGAHLTARGRGLPRFEFGAWKNSPSRPARFNASIKERRGALLIERAVGVKAAPAAFAYDVQAGRATVMPPSPFSGKATYRRDGGSVSWQGDLSVDFPGREGVRLSGPGSRASMVRAVQNPSHPFRLP